jgi:hypothetical protein
MSTRDLFGGGGWPTLKTKTLPPSVCRASRECGSVDASQTSGRPRPVSGITLLIFNIVYFVNRSVESNRSCILEKGESFVSPYSVQTAVGPTQPLIRVRAGPSLPTADDLL